MPGASRMPFGPPPVPTYAPSRPGTFPRIGRSSGVTGAQAGGLLEQAGLGDRRHQRHGGVVEGVVRPLARLLVEAGVLLGRGEPDLAVLPAEQRDARRHDVALERAGRTASFGGSRP